MLRGGPLRTFGALKGKETFNRYLLDSLKSPDILTAFFPFILQIKNAKTLNTMTVDPLGFKSLGSMKKAIVLGQHPWPGSPALGWGPS